MTVIERLQEQRINQLEFRLQTLERAVLTLAERVSQLDVFYQRGAKRLLSDIFEEEERRQ